MTVYNLLKQAGIKASKKQIGDLGHNIKSSASARGIEVNKISQDEDGIIFSVYDYPDTFIPQMEKTIRKYYRKQAKILASA